MKIADFLAKHTGLKNLVLIGGKSDNALYQSLYDFPSDPHAGQVRIIVITKSRDLLLRLMALTIEAQRELVTILHKEAMELGGFLRLEDEQAGNTLLVSIAREQDTTTMHLS